MYASSGLLMRLTSRMRSTEPWGAQCLNLITAGVAGFPAQELRECILVAREARRSSKGRKRVIVSCIILGLGYRCATSFEHRPSLPLESTPLSRNSAWYRSVQFVYATVQTGDFLAPNSSPVPLPFSKRGTFATDSRGQSGESRCRGLDFNPRKVGENLLLELVSKAVSEASLKAILSLGSRIEAFGN
jgi:hypothetical protein